MVQHYTFALGEECENEINYWGAFIPEVGRDLCHTGGTGVNLVPPDM